MNILQEKQNQESQETICKTHNQEFIAVDLDMSNKSQIKFFCGLCLVDKLNNTEVTTIQQSKEMIQKIKTQQQEIKTKENQARLKYYKNILDQIMDFQKSIDDSLSKMYKQIQEYIFPIQKQKIQLLDFQQQFNYFEDIKYLSELYSSDEQKSTNLIQDNSFIDEITRQFELLFNSAEYFQSLDTLKYTKQTIQDLMENNVIELPQLLSTKNESKTPSLNKICTNHKKEIIMIDMDSQKKKIEDRFVCVDCIAENPQIKYQTIENVNKQWRVSKQESEKILQKYKKESKDQKYMRKNYNKKLNEISEKLIAEQYQSIDNSKQQKKKNKYESKQSNQRRNISIQVLEDEQFLEDLKQLFDKDKVAQNQAIIDFKNKDSNFKKEIENHLQSLRQYDQQDIQQSLNLLKEISIERNLIIKLQELNTQFSKCVENENENYQDQIEIIQDIQELIDQIKQYQCQINLFDQTITLYQQHTNKIDQIQQKISNQNKDQVTKQELIYTQYQNLQNILNDYIITLDIKCKQIKQYCNIQQFEIELVKLKEMNQHLETEKANLLNQMSISLNQRQQEHQEELIKQKQEYQKKIDLIQKENTHFKELFDQKIQEILNLKKQHEEDKLETIRISEEKQINAIAEMDKQMNQKEIELQTLQRKLDQIEQEKLEKYKRKQLEIEKISQQYQKALLFSNTYKGLNCQVSQGGKVVECLNSYYQCLCEQAIPKKGKIWFAFQILKMTVSVFVGIGFREIIKSKNYLYPGYGSYFIKNNGYAYSHHNKDVNDKELSFSYTTNDVIIIEVSIEHKYIKWTKQNNSNLTTVQLEIDTSISQELYPCVYLHDSKVQILSDISI